VSKAKSPAEDAPSPFAHLLDGEETADSVQLRYVTFQEFWSKQEEEIQVS
jgi:hypothetical protein